MLRNLLVASDVNVHYGEINVLKGVTLDVGQSELVGVFGRNASGKSTLISTIAGLNKISWGTITFLDKRIDGMPPHEIVRYGISLVPEGRHLFPSLSVLENLKVGSYVSNDARVKANENMRGVFEQFPQLERLKEKSARNLSGGEQQMLAIGRALMSMPRLLMLDEPLLGLSPKVAYEVLAQLLEIRKKGLSILIVEQNLDAVLEFADRGLILESGRIVASGKKSELMSDNEIRKKYFGLA